MSKLASVSHPLLPLVLAVVALLGTACSGAADERPGYATGGDDYVLDSAPLAGGCQSGAIKSCTIWLGQHGDLSNCVFGMDVCTDEGTWSGCIDEQTMADSPELYASLTSGQATSAE